MLKSHKTELINFNYRKLEQKVSISSEYEYLKIWWTQKNLWLAPSKFLLFTFTHIPNRVP